MIESNLSNFKSPLSRGTKDFFMLNDFSTYRFTQLHKNLLRWIVD